jgi:hypothetical protein
MAFKKLSHFVTKDVLHINPNERYRRQPKDLEKRAKEAILHPYLEKEPSVGEWLRQFAPSREGAAQYMHNLFPSATWMRRYNLHWMLGDAIAGKCCFSPIPTDIANLLIRSDHRYCYHPPSDGVCASRPAEPRVWFIHVLHWCGALLAIWDVQGHCHRSE